MSRPADQKAIDWSAWPEPDPALGDGSDQGESEVDDGTPGAENDGTVPA